MFAFDLPTDVPPAYAPIVIAQGSQVKGGKIKLERTLGVCQQA